MVRILVVMFMLYEGGYSRMLPAGVGLYRVLVSHGFFPLFTPAPRVSGVGSIFWVAEGSRATEGSRAAVGS